MHHCTVRISPRSALTLVSTGLVALTRVRVLLGPPSCPLGIAAAPRLPVIQEDNDGNLVLNSLISAHTLWCPDGTRTPSADAITRRQLGVPAVGLALIASLLLNAGVAVAALSGGASYAPPASGAFAYNSFVPALTPGASYVDPAFGETVRRLTTDHGRNDLYARNMWWNANETRYLHRTAGVAGKADRWNVIDVATGAVTHTGIPFGTFAADGGFDPADPNALYYLVSDRGDGRGEIRQITLKSGGTWTETVYFTAPARIADLGGTLNWFDASGRYMLVRYGAEPSIHVYDRQNLGAGPYANPIDATNSIERGGYMGLTPDGHFVVGYDDRPVGFGGMGQGVSWRIDHTNRTIAAAPTVFWSLCGDHGSFLSASDGRNYMIVNDCYSQPGLWRVDITNNADGLNEKPTADTSQQRAHPGLHHVERLRACVDRGSRRIPGLGLPRQ
jgi:hypothetical protein